MAFTIRKLSDTAEKNLEKIQKEETFLNTNTKAIDFVLRTYFIKEKELEKKRNKIEELENRLYKSSNEIIKVKDALKVLKDF